MADNVISKIKLPDNQEYILKDSNAARSDHTHDIALEKDTSGTNQLTLAAGTKYKLTAGGESYIFTTPADANNKVTIAADTTTNANYPLVFGSTNTSTTTAKTEGLQKSTTKFYVNPSTGNIQATTFNGIALTAAAGKSITDNSSNADVTSSDTNLITGRTLYYQLAKKGYTTNTGTVTSVTLKAGNGIMLDTDNTPITTSGSRTISVSYGTSASVIGITSSAGTANTVSRSDHTHKIEIDEGTNNGEISIAGVTVKPKGIAALAYKASLAASDIPNLAWSKITSGKPTTLSGYGITDAKIDGGVITLGSNTITPVTSVNGHTGNVVNVTAGDLGLSSALRYVGKTTSTMSESFNGVPAGISGYTKPIVGDVVLDSAGNGEYVCVAVNGTTYTWESLGSESSFKKVQTAVSSPSAGNSAQIEFINTISQDEQGVISATKQPVRIASKTQTGVIQITKDNTNLFLNTLDTGSNTPTDNDYYISQYVGGGTTTTTYHRRPVSALYSYIKSKTDTLYLKLAGGTMSGDILGNATATLGSTTNPWHQLVLGGATSATVTSASTNPRITFQESSNGSQPVHLIYSDYDNYRSPAGLKVVGGTSATPAWFEVEGSIFANGGHRVPTTGNSSGTVGGTTTPVYIEGGVIKAGTALKNLAYKDSLTYSDVGAAASTHTHSTQDLYRPNALNGVNDITYQSLINDVRANRLAFLPADQIIIEKTTDGGTTWVDANISDSTKTALFSQTRPGGVYIPQINGQINTLCGLRITITAMKYNVPAGTAETEKYNYWNSNYVVSTERYNQLKNMYFWVSSANNSIGVKVERATGANSTSWVTVFDKTDYGMTGWSGNDIINFSQGAFGGGTNQTGQYWNYRITLMSRGPGGSMTLNSNSITSVQNVSEIRGYGDTQWVAGNYLASIDHLYSWDYNKNAIFPADIRPQINNTASLGTSSFKWAKVYATTFTGDLTGNATNVTGTVAIANGGTGKTTALDAANALISGLPIWTANPTDDTYLIRRNTDGTATFGQVKFGTVWNYIKGKADSTYSASGHNHDSTYLKLSGGEMTGNIRRFYNTSSSEALLTVLSNNQDVKLWEMGHGTASGTTIGTSNGYKLLYKGANSSTNNYLQLIARTGSGDDIVAMQVDELGKVSFTNSIIANLTGTATTATNLANKPSLAVSDTSKITVTAGGKTSDAFTVPYATSAGSAGTATTATNLANKPSIAASGNNITITAGGKTSDAFTVPYATSATNLSAAPTITKTGTSTIDLTAGTAYTLTVGGQSVIFKTPADSDTKVTLAAITSGTAYYPVVGTGTGNAQRQIDTTGFAYKGTNGTTSAVGAAELTLGNSTASGTANNKQGKLTLYGSTAYTHTLLGAPTSARTITLPDATGTVELTNHIHGNLTHDGKITSTTTIANGDKLVIVDSDSKIIGSSITFDGSTTTKALTQKGTWETFNNYSHPTGDGNLHVPATGTTHNGQVLKAGSTAGSISWGTLSASDVGALAVGGNAVSATTATNLSAAPTITATGTATVNLAANTTYTLTVGGKSVVFKTPSDANTNTLVNYTLGETTKAYLMASQNAPTTTTTARAAHGDTGVYLTATAGEFSAVRHSYNVAGIERAYTHYNMTDQSIDFVFV